MGDWAKKLSSQILWLKTVGKSGKLPIPNLQTPRYKSVGRLRNSVRRTNCPRCHHCRYHYRMSIFSGVIVFFFFEVGSGLEWSEVDACVLGALDSHDWSTHQSLLEAFGSPLHELSTHDDSFLEVFGLPFHELSTHDDRFYPDTSRWLEAPLPPFGEGPPLPLELPAYAECL